MNTTGRAREPIAYTDLERTPLLTLPPLVPQREATAASDCSLAPLDRGPIACMQ